MVSNDPIEEYLMGLRLLEDVADDVDVLIPGHGSIGGADQVRTRIDLDRAYVHALRGGRAPDDPVSSIPTAGNAGSRRAGGRSP